MTTEENWWIDHSNTFCSVNKVVILDFVIDSNDIWISGLIAYQTDHRCSLKIFEERVDIVKFHPITNLDKGE